LSGQAVNTLAVSIHGAATGKHYDLSQFIIKPSTCPPEGGTVNIQRRLF